ncbi:Uncharacterised protein [Clostridium baratii]|uniref:hypothetical protein n=1 Tax=Clostridium baratii TaxID=1561 RepID=UPI0006C438B9|nr:hypothetical protein [Clostridium baratii]CUP24593.1 Uncharacterised protein [Clostridium baratii]
MSKKSELLSLIKGYMNKQTKISDEVTSINKNNELTPEGKEIRINKLVDSFSGTAQNTHDKVIEIIDSAIKGLQDKWKANSAGMLLDSNYQIGLANAIKMIETGAITNLEDFKNIIEVYKDDYNALATISNLVRADRPDLLMSIPVDNREYNLKLLNDLRNNIDNNINAYDVTNDMSLVFSGLIHFIETRFGDDFIVIPWEEVNQ